MSRPILFLSYLFPPRGGAGVQRALKFVKYLPEFGFRPLVVTNGGSAKDHVTTVQDQTLLGDLPGGSVVVPTKLNEAEQREFKAMQKPWRRRLEPTDPMSWWVKPAVRTALELAEKHEPEAIFVTMSPFTAAEAGIELKKRTGLPLIFDLRDPWALDETKIYPTVWHAWRDWRRMERALAAADLVMMNTPESMRAAREAFGTSVRMVSLTNGFDGEDFARASTEAAAQVPAAGGDVLRIVHTGMFHSELAGIWDRLNERRGVVSRLKYARRPINLWSRTPRYLLEAMERLIKSGRVAAGKFELVLVGELSAADKELVERSGVRERVRILGYQTHDQSVNWLKSADVLFLPLQTPLDGGAATIVPGKAYEYLGSGRAILAMGPKGDMRRFVQEAKAGICVDGTDVNGAAEALGRMYDAKMSGRPCCSPDMSYIERFERRELARRLAEELEETIGVRQSAGSGGRDASEYLSMTTERPRPI